jgi:hypothetical protein
MRATFRSSRISKNYWHEVVKSCCLALNEIPRKGFNQSPWEIMHGHPFPASFLKPLGTTSVILNMNRTKGRKFKEKGQEGILVGFNVSLQSYRVITQSGSVVESKHVRFLKSNQFESVATDSDGPYKDILQISPNTQSATPEKPHREEDSSSNENSEPANQEGIRQEDDMRSDDSSDSENQILDLLKPQQETPQQSEVTTNRSLRDRSTLKPPVRFGFHHYYKPNTFESAIRCADEKFWRSAIEKEVS